MDFIKMFNITHQSQMIHKLPRLNLLVIKIICLHLTHKCYQISNALDYVQHVGVCTQLMFIIQCVGPPHLSSLRHYLICSLIAWNPYPIQLFLFFSPFTSVVHMSMGNVLSALVCSLILYILFIILHLSTLLHI